MSNSIRDEHNCAAWPLAKATVKDNLACEPVIGPSRAQVGPEQDLDCDKHRTEPDPLALFAAACVFALCAGSLRADAEEATFTVKQLTPATALKLGHAALDACRKEGFQVTIAVTDRSGVPQVILRDRYAGPHTVTVAINKAWTSVSFRQDTLSFAKATADPLHSGPRHFERVVAVGGGVPVEAGGAILGAVGVSGAPGGEADDRCARAGIEAVRADIDF